MRQPTRPRRVLAHRRVCDLGEETGGARELRTPSRGRELAPVGRSDPGAGPQPGRGAAAPDGAVRGAEAPIPYWGAPPITRVALARDAGRFRDQKRDALRPAPGKMVSDRGTRVYRPGMQSDRVEPNLAALPTA